MLPADFEWREWFDCQALYLGDKVLASITPLVNGRFRVCMNPGNIAIRYEFCDTLPGAVLCVEMWAEKWESRLRQVPH